MNITECKAYRVDGSLFETKKQAEGAIKDLKKVNALNTIIGKTPPQMYGFVFGLVDTVQQRENYRKFLDELDAIDGVVKKSKLIKLKP